MTVVAAANDPTTVVSADDLSNVVWPDDDSADRRAASAHTKMSPSTRAVVLWSRISANLRTHVPAAPGSRSSRRVMMRMVHPAMLMMVVVAIMAVSVRFCRR